MLDTKYENMFATVADVARACNTFHQDVFRLAVLAKVEMVTVIGKKVFYSADIPKMLAVAQARKASQSPTSTGAGHV